MKTQIFKDYEEFLSREDKRINGCTAELAEYNNINLDEDNRNEGCWNCVDCKRCIDCFECNRCKYCINCRWCSSCNDCEHCDYCGYCNCCNNSDECIHCKDLTGCSNYDSNEAQNNED